MSKATVFLGTLSASIGLTGAVIGSVALAKVESVTGTAPSTVTVSATPESATASADDVRAAAAAACGAFGNFKSGVGIARGTFIDRVDRANDWESPESLGTQAYYFSAVSSELTYLDARVGPNTPESITSAVASMRRSLTAVVDADLRREPASISNKVLDEYSATLGTVESSCTAAGVG